MKRGSGRLRPLDIVEVPTGRPDPRSAEPDLVSRERAVTQKISREQLEEVLKRTKSGTRRAIRSEPEIPPDDNDPRREPDSQRDVQAGSPRDSLPGPRDDEENPHVGPRMTSVTPIVESAESLVVHTLATPRIERKRFLWATERVHITPRLAFLAGLAVAVFVLVAAAVGFVAGRLVPGSR